MEEKAFVFDIKRNTSEDGPGIRTTVFFKGCPLSCTWCQNPEGIDSGPSLSFRQDLCRPEDCSTPCVKACPDNALHFDQQMLSVDHDWCNHCGLCVPRCPNQALELVGRWYSVEELCYRVCIDAPFFRSTGGGVTASGGECTTQMTFLQAFFQKLKAQDIQTAIETNGVFNFERFCRRLLPWLDLIYFDIKLIDEAESIRYTGHSNRPILDNLVRLHEVVEIPLVVRIPLVPGITDSEHNLKGIGRFLQQHGIGQASLLPYNPLWQDKVQRFGLEPRYGYSSFMSQTAIEQCIRYLNNP